MKVLITGGAGFIGTNFIFYWCKHHPRDLVVNFDKLTYAGDRNNLKKLEKSSRYCFVCGDTTNKQAVDRVMKKVDLVVNFAAESHVDRSINNPQVFLETNVLGTFNLLEAALENKVNRFHHISTDEVYGSLSLGSKNKFSEKTKYEPSSPYSASKAASDHLVLSYWQTFGLPVTITNCSNNYGPYQYPEKFIPRMITNLLEGKKIPIYGDGKYVRDWLHVEDHARAIEAVLIKGRPGETYCVGGLKKDINNLEIAKMILKIMGKNDKDWLEFVVDRAGHDRRYAVDWNKISQELGWKPRYNLTMGLEQTVEWYRNNSSWWQNKKQEAERFYQQTNKK
ncbi:MAG: dTDP-glucose 4,6-dehydratase [Candidatus Shapirobacteria bacterium]|nr:dTDP-glucose 4,6-dehydratase [Candidatus Shapirobacteria bacterium]